jgi:hypothetical protein
LGLLNVLTPGNARVGLGFFLLMALSIHAGLTLALWR